MSQAVALLKGNPGGLKAIETVQAWLAAPEVTQLTSITISGPAVIHSLEPLAALPRLRKLHLGKLQALSLAGSRIDGRLDDTCLVVLNGIRVLDVRQTCLGNALEAVLWDLKSLRLVTFDPGSDLDLNLPDTTLHHWRAELVSDVPGNDQAKSGSLGRMELRNARLTGINFEKDAADEDRMRMFETFWQAHMAKYGPAAHKGNTNDSDMQSPLIDSKVASDDVPESVTTPCSDDDVDGLSLQDPSNMMMVPAVG
ncbi:hypothetical protein WJX73_009177 [Symbiochloris irregularis]|uniref:Uncharacterized protein n=1 Tax=Symbiochloris irregularis TaxID=706552 RepID=A0AAW1P4J8_9CHLO